MFFLRLENFLKNIYQLHTIKILKYSLIIVLLFSAFSNARSLTKTLYTGKIKDQYIKPLYNYMQSPDNLPNEASLKFGADNLCLYSAANNYNQTGVMYSLKADPWGRPAMTFPPHLIYLTSRLVPTLSFPKALLLSNYLQILLFILVSIYFMRSSSVDKNNIFIASSLILFLIFCTTVGMAWFERGQTDLYNGIAYLFFIKAIRDERKFDFLLAGIFLSLKWAGIPFFVFFSILYLIIAKSKKTSFLNLTIAALPALLLLLPFDENSWSYLELIKDAEATDQPLGMSLALFYSRIGGKILPFIQTYLFALLLLNARIPLNVKKTIEFVFIVLFSFTCTAFGTYAFEYRVVSILFLIPFFVSNQLVFNQNEKYHFSKFSMVFFIGFLLYAFRFESQFTFINEFINSKHGRPVFNLLTGMLIYLNIRYSKKYGVTQI